MFSGLPWELVYQKEFSTRSASVNHEREIKKRGALRYLTDLEKLSG
jgi:predicted GIY-YIG superfamily endonuclease